MFKKAGLPSIIFFQIWLSHLHCSMVFDGSIRKILDIGGNTGKWAIASARFVKDIEITIMDLPGQLDVAREKVKQAGLGERISFYPANLLDENI